LACQIALDNPALTRLAATRAALKKSGAHDRLNIVRKIQDTTAAFHAPAACATADLDL
jgi:hypothetical protein